MCPHHSLGESPAVEFPNTKLDVVDVFNDEDALLIAEVPFKLTLFVDPERPIK